MTEPAEDQPNTAPDWAFSADQELTCPECSTLLAGLNWVMSEPVTEEIAEGVTQTSGMVVTGMKLVPCDHVLDADTWELQYTGRDRLSGAIIRHPRFTRKKGS